MYVSDGKECLRFICSHLTKTWIIHTVNTLISLTLINYLYFNGEVVVPQKTKIQQQQSSFLTSAKSLLPARGLKLCFASYFLFSRSGYWVVRKQAPSWEKPETELSRWQRTRRPESSPATWVSEAFPRFPLPLSSNVKNTQRGISGFLEDFPSNWKYSIRTDILYVSNSRHSYPFVSLHQGNDSVLELFTVLSEEEVQKKMAKKLKKVKKKAAK